MVDTAIGVDTQESAILCRTNRPHREGETYMDGVMYQYANDPNCVAFQCVL